MLSRVSIQREAMQGESGDMSNNLKQIWEAFCASPGEETFHPLYEHTRALMYTICYRVLRNDEDARDAFQSTYCRLLALAKEDALPEESDNVTVFVSRLVFRDEIIRWKTMSISQIKAPPICG